MTGPAALLAPCVKAHQFVVFTVATNLQQAVAHGLDHEGSFYRWGAHGMSGGNHWEGCRQLNWLGGVCLRALVRGHILVKVRSMLIMLPLRFSLSLRMLRESDSI
jgi:hypothetical protein